MLVTRVFSLLEILTQDSNVSSYDTTYDTLGHIAIQECRRRRYLKIPVPLITRTNANVWEHETFLAHPLKEIQLHLGDRTGVVRPTVAALLSVAPRAPTTL